MAAGVVVVDFGWEGRIETSVQERTRGPKVSRSDPSSSSLTTIVFFARDSF